MKCTYVINGHDGGYATYKYPDDSFVSDTEINRYLSSIGCCPRRDFNVGLLLENNRIIVSYVNKYQSVGVPMYFKNMIISEIDKQILDKYFDNILSCRFSSKEDFEQICKNKTMISKLAKGIPETPMHFMDIAVDDNALIEILYEFVKRLITGEREPIFICVPSSEEASYREYCIAAMSHITRHLPVGLKAKASFSMATGSNNDLYSFVFIDEDETGIGSLTYRIDRLNGSHMADKEIELLVTKLVQDADYLLQIKENIDSKYEIKQLTASKYVSYLKLEEYDNIKEISLNCLKDWDNALRRLRTIKDEFYKKNLYEVISRLISEDVISAGKLSGIFFDERILTYDGLVTFLNSYSEILMYLADNGVVLNDELLFSYNSVICSLSGEEDKEIFYENINDSFNVKKNELQHYFTDNGINFIEKNIQDRIKEARLNKTIRKLDKKLQDCTSFAEAVKCINSVITDEEKGTVQLDANILMKVYDNITYINPVDSDATAYVNLFNDYTAARSCLKKYFPQELITEIDNRIASIQKHILELSESKLKEEVSKCATFEALIKVFDKYYGLNLISSDKTLLDNAFTYFYDTVLYSKICNNDDDEYLDVLDIDAYEQKLITVGVSKAKFFEIRENIYELRNAYHKKTDALGLTSTVANIKGKYGYSLATNTQYEDFITNETTDTQVYKPIDDEIKGRKKGKSIFKEILKIAIIALISLFVGFIIGFILGNHYNKNNGNTGISSPTDADIDITEYDADVDETDDNTEVSSEEDDDSMDDIRSDDECIDENDGDKELSLISEGVRDAWESGDVERINETKEIFETYGVNAIIRMIDSDKSDQNERKVLEEYLIVKCAMEDEGFDAENFELISAAIWKSDNISQQIASYYGYDEVESDIFVMVKYRSSSNSYPPYGSTYSETTENEILSLFYFDGNGCKKVADDFMERLDIENVYDKEEISSAIRLQIINENLVYMIDKNKFN